MPLCNLVSIGWGGGEGNFKISWGIFPPQMALLTKQAASDRQQNVGWQGLLQVSTWHDCSYIAGIPLLLMVDCEACPCSL